MRLMPTQPGVSHLTDFTWQESSCSICLNTFLDAIAEEETAYVMESPAQPVEDLGITGLVGTCERVFCQKGLSSLLPCTSFRSLIIRARIAQTVFNTCVYQISLI
jgi:hypothetical protein